MVNKERKIKVDSFDNMVIPISTELPEGHTRQERIDELKGFKELFKDNERAVRYITNRIRYYEDMTETQFSTLRVKTKGKSDGKN